MWGSFLRRLRILLLKLYLDQNYDDDSLAFLRKKRSFLMLIFKAWSPEKTGVFSIKGGLATADALSLWA